MMIISVLITKLYQILFSVMVAMIILMESRFSRPAASGQGKSLMASPSG
jgi:hypothetical protein